MHDYSRQQNYLLKAMKASLQLKRWPIATPVLMRQGTVRTPQPMGRAAAIQQIRGLGIREVAGMKVEAVGEAVVEVAEAVGKVGAKGKGLGAMIGVGGTRRRIWGVGNMGPFYQKLILCLTN